MGRNFNRSYRFEGFYRDKNFVEKSLLINVTNNNLDKEDSKFMCVTRPRRFGKTLALVMLNAYYSKGENSKEVFDRYKISNSPNYLKHLNKHNVFVLDIGSVYCQGYRDENPFIYLEDCLLDDLKEEFKNVDLDNCSFKDALIKVNKITKEKFIFLMDEWDCILRDAPNTKLEEYFVSFFGTLLNDKEARSTIELFYMTGILPTKYYEKFTSSIYIFNDYSTLFPKGTEEFIGYTESELEMLCKKNDCDFEKFKYWYKGYNFNGLTIYNPFSVNDALDDNKLSDRWIDSCSIESLSNPLNIGDDKLKEIVAFLIIDEPIHLDIPDDISEIVNSKTKEAVLIKLIHLGYLTYDLKSKECRITDYEIKIRFDSVVWELKWKELSVPIDDNSRDLYDYTLKGYTNYINEILDQNFNSIIQISEKVKENIFKFILRLSYFYSNHRYKFDFIELNDKDSVLVFIPLYESYISMIIQYKVDDKIEDSINQIKQKDYLSKFTGYKGKVLLVGITFDSSTLKHESKIEYIKL